MILSNDLRWMCKVSKCFSGGMKYLGTFLVPVLWPRLFSGCVAGTVASQLLAVALAGRRWQQLLPVAPAVICWRNWLLQCQGDVGYGWKEWITDRCQMCPASHQFTFGVHSAAVCACVSWEGNHPCSWGPWEHKIIWFKNEAGVLNGLCSLAFKMATSLQSSVQLGWGFEAFIFYFYHWIFPFVQNVQSHTLGRIFTSSALENTCKISLLKTWSMLSVHHK